MPETRALNMAEIDPTFESFHLNSPVVNRLSRASSLDVVDEDFILDEIYEDADFDFDISSYRSDAKSLLQSFIKREVIKQTLKKQLNKLLSLKQAASSTLNSKRDSVKNSLLQGKKRMSKENIKKILVSKKEQLENKIQTPPFLRTSDKVAFTVGIVVLVLTEMILLKAPEYMYIWYTFLLFPLLLARYYFYSKAKFQYFMLDFCYFAQVMLMVYLYVVPTNALWFQVVFSASNGPLLAGVVMWRNSLVFHDLDKLTSVFIHIFPPLVTFCLRWYPLSETYEGVCETSSCSIDWLAAFGLTLALYITWQILYLIKTEVVDRSIIASDKQIMTSARWMSEVKPHPVWKFFVKKGAGPRWAVPVLVGVQFAYTIATILPMMLIFRYFFVHVAYISVVFLICVWNGANFYFEIFSETYSKRLQRFILDNSKTSETAIKEAFGIHSAPSSNVPHATTQQHSAHNNEAAHTTLSTDEKVKPHHPNIGESLLSSMKSTFMAGANLSTENDHAASQDIVAEDKHHRD